MKDEPKLKEVVSFVQVPTLISMNPMDLRVTQ